MDIFSIYAPTAINARNLSSAIIMSDDTAAHFYAWLEHMVPRPKQFETEQNILALLRDHPDLILTHSWPEMERMAMR